MDVIKTMDRLSNAQGVTGFEHAGITATVCELFRETAEGLENVRVRSDVSGSAFVTVGSGSPHVLVMAHLDEVAMIVMGIEKNGMLRVASAAGADPKVLPGSRVRVYGRRELTGIVGAIPPHLTASKSAAYKWEELSVDIGLPFEKASELVRVGDRVTFFPEGVLELKNGFISSKTLDDRALVLAELHCLELLKKRRFKGEITMCASVNEEKTGLGAVTATYAEKPDMAIVMDVTFGKSACSSDCFDMDKVMLSIGPNIHPKVLKQLEEAADEAKIPYELEAEMGPTGTDATDVQISRLGVPCGLISPPLRYMHTPVETISTDTLLNCGKLLAEFVTRIGDDWREKLCLD